VGVLRANPVARETTERHNSQAIIPISEPTRSKP